MKGPLTFAKIKSLKEPGFYGDGGTLYLRIAPGGSKQWVQRLVIRGRRHDLGLGGWPLVSLLEARETAFENRKQARRVKTSWRPNNVKLPRRLRKQWKR